MQEAKALYVRAPEMLGEVERLMRVLENHLVTEGQLASNDPDLLAEIGDLHTALGETRYSNRSANLGLIDKAARNFELAIQALERAVELRPGDAGLIHHLGNAYEPMGGLLRLRGQYDEARAAHERVLELVEPFEPINTSNNEVVILQYCFAHDSLARLAMTEGDYPRALEHAQSVADAWRGLYDQNEASRPYSARLDRDGRRPRRADPPGDGGDEEALRRTEVLDDILSDASVLHDSVQGAQRPWITQQGVKAEGLLRLGQEGARQVLDEVLELTRRRALRSTRRVRTPRPHLVPQFACLDGAGR